jgi:hypothetical protein
MGKSEKFLEGIKFPCFIESAKFYIDKEQHRKVKVVIVVRVDESVQKALPHNVAQVTMDMVTNKLEEVVFSTEWEERLVEIYASETKPTPAIVAEDVAIKSAKALCDVETGAVTLKFSFIGDDKIIGDWIHHNYGKDVFINVLAMQGELTGLES